MKTRHAHALEIWTTLGQPPVVIMEDLEKRPRQKGWQKIENQAPKPILGKNWGLMCCKDTGFFAIDIDCYDKKGEPTKWADTPFAKHFKDGFLNVEGILSSAMITKSGSGGYHLILKDNDITHRFINKANAAHKIDIRTTCSTGSGGMVVMGGSRNKNGSYECVNMIEPDSMPICLQRFFYKYKEDFCNVDTTEEVLIPDRRAKHEHFTIREQVVNLLSKERAWDYDRWLRVGFACATEGLQAAFINFSKKSLNYDESACYKLYEDAINSNSSRRLTFASIIRWATEDCNTQEDKNTLARLRQKLKCKKNYRFDIYNADAREWCELIKQCYPDNFKNYGKNLNYYFTGKYWINNTEMNFLFQKLSDKPYKIVEEIFDKEKERLDKEVKKERRAWLDEHCEMKGFKAKVEPLKNKDKKNILGQLRNYTTATAICNFYRKMIKEEIDVASSGMPDIFDSQKYIIQFNNCVFDLDDYTIKDCDPKYMSTLTTGYNLVGREHCKKEIAELTELLEEILPKQDDRDYLMTALATGLEAQQIEILVLLIGCGGNGKGVLMELVGAAMGQYYYIGNPDCLLGGGRKGGGNPEVSNFHNKRIIRLTEPDANATFNIATAKQLTGDQSINARALYSNNCSTFLKSTMFLETNAAIDPDGMDEGFARRYKEINFPMRYRSNIEGMEDDKYVKQSNGYYKSRAFKEKYKTALFYILTDYHKVYKENGSKLKDTEKITLRTKQLMADNDEVWSWFSRNYNKKEVNDNMKPSHIKIMDLYSAFKDSTVYSNWTKKEKRKLNNKVFQDRIRSSKLFSEFTKYYANRKMVLGKSYKGMVIVGWEKKMNVQIIDDLDSNE